MSTDLSSSSNQPVPVVSKLPVFGFAPGQNDQLARLDRNNWGTKIPVGKERHDTGVQDFAEEITQVLKSLQDAIGALGSNAGDIANAYNDLVNYLSQYANTLNVLNQFVDSLSTGSDIFQNFQDILEQYIQNIASGGGTGASGDVQIPTEFEVTVDGCDVTLTPSAYTTLTFTNGLLTGVA